MSKNENSERFIIKSIITIALNIKVKRGSDQEENDIHKGGKAKKTKLQTHIRSSADGIGFVH